MAGTASQETASPDRASDPGHATHESGAHESGAHDSGEQEGSRRDFLKILTISAAGVAGAAIAWPFLDALAPSQDAQSAAKVSVDVAGIENDSAITVVWRGKPVFIRKLTDAEVQAAENTPLSSLPDPVAFRWRTHPGYEHYVVVIGLCTHRGCVPLGSAQGEPRGPYGGWICPCHGATFDTAGRVRSGPAEKNLVLPPYEFVSATQLVIG